MDGMTVASNGSLPQISDLNWQIVGVRDFDGDGKADILWRNMSNGADYMWLMNGFSIASQGAVPMIGDTNWKIFQ